MATSIPSNSITKFLMASAPVGWTKITTFNDCSVRITSGTASNGGTSNFSTTFVSKTASGTRNLSLATDSVSAGSPTHNHANSSRNYSVVASNVNPAGTSPSMPALSGGAPTQTTSGSGAAGSGQGHAHPVNATPLNGASVTGSTVNFAVNYIDVIIAQRN